MKTPRLKISFPKLVGKLRTLEEYDISSSLIARYKKVMGVNEMGMRNLSNDELAKMCWLGVEVFYEFDLESDVDDFKDFERKLASAFKNARPFRRHMLF